MTSNDILTSTQLSGDWVAFSEAIAWVRTRDAVLASEVADERGFHLAWKLAVWTQENGNAAVWLSPDDAKAEFLGRLRKGKIKARGRPIAKPSASHVDLSTADWSGHVFEERSTLENETVASPRRRDVRRGWFDLLFNAERLLAEFPRTRATLADSVQADRAAAALRHNPAGEARWTVPMVLAWIATREIDDVRRVSDDYREDIGEPPADIEDLSPIAKDAVLEAWRDLRRKAEAEAGSLRAQGIHETSREGVSLSPALWRGMKPGRGKAGFVCVAPAAAGYCRVTFAAEEVRELWPGLPKATIEPEVAEEPQVLEPSPERAGMEEPEILAPAPPNSPSEPALKRWGQGMVAEWQAAGASLSAVPTEGAICEAAKVKWPAVAERRVLAMWRVTRPDAGQAKRGRRKASPA